MTQTVFLHVGAFKTGTTYLQHVLWHNRALLADEGILVPGRRAQREQPLAAWDLLKASRGGYRSPDADGAWRRLVRQVASWDGPTAVASMEFLSLAKPRHMQKVVRDLAPAQVHVVLTARDLGRVLPAAWQERMKNSKSYTWQEFAAAIEDPARADESPARGFWLQQDLPGILARWAAVVPADRVHVVTVPPAGAPATVLLDRLGQVIGSDATRWDPDVERTNESIGAVEAGLLRRVNPRIRDAVPWPAYEHLVKNLLARDVLGARPVGRRIGLPEEHRPWVTERARKLVADLDAAGYAVVGDLDDLLPAEPAPGREPQCPDDVTSEELLEAAEDGIVGMVLDLGPRIIDIRAKRREAVAETRLAEQRVEQLIAERDALRAHVERVEQMPTVRARRLAGRIKRRLQRTVRREPPTKKSPAKNAPAKKAPPGRAR